MNKERLEHLITVLEGVKAASLPFNLNNWIAHHESNDQTTGNAVESCGTACCALGYAALDPVFRAQGLSMNALVMTYKEGDMSSSIVSEMPIASIAEFNTALKTVQDGQWMASEVDFDDGFGFGSGFDAAAAFFGINNNASYYLFDPEEYAGGTERPITPDEVIERVREVIAKEGVIEMLKLRSETSFEDEYDEYADYVHEDEDEDEDELSA